jgi:hypothetical protein
MKARAWGAVTMAGIAAVAAVISYSDGLFLVRLAGNRDWHAYLYPLLPDGLIVICLIALLAAGKRAKWPTFGLGLGIALTLAMNVAAGIAHSPLDAVVDGAVPVVFFVAVEVFIGYVKRGRAVVPPQHGPAAPTRTGLYKLFGDADELLYVGISLNPETRIMEHSWRKPWWPEVKRAATEWHATWAEAAEAERVAIGEGEPKYNRKRAGVDPGPRKDRFRPVPQDALDAARIALAASFEAGNPLSVNALHERFGVPRRRASQMRAEVAQTMPPQPPQRWAARKTTKAIAVLDEMNGGEKAATDTPAGELTPAAAATPAGVLIPSSNGRPHGT